MSSEVAWTVFWVGVVSLCCSQVALWLSSRIVVYAMMAFALVATSVAVALQVEPLRVQAFASVFQAIGIVVTVAKLAFDRYNEERTKLALERDKRSALLLSEWRSFVAEQRFVLAIYILETDDPRLESLVARVTYPEYVEWKQPLDQVFEFMLRLVYAVKRGDLESKDVATAVGWYFRRVLELPTVKGYCKQHGYGDLIAFAEELRGAGDIVTSTQQMLINRPPRAPQADAGAVHHDH